MPNVAGREFPYTPQGMAAADQYRQSLGMRHGGSMGFRPLGMQAGGVPGAGAAASEPFSYSSEEARAAVIEYIRIEADIPIRFLLGLSDEQLRNAYTGISMKAPPTMPRPSDRDFDMPLPSPPMPRPSDRGFDMPMPPMPMPRPSDRDFDMPMPPTPRPAPQEVIPQTPILPPGTGAYEMRWDPNIATTPAVADAYYGGGIPGPSFVPTDDQTAPDFREYAGGGYVGRGMRHGGLMSLRRR